MRIDTFLVNAMVWASGCIGGTEAGPGAGGPQRDPDDGMVEVDETVPVSYTLAPEYHLVNRFDVGLGLVLPDHVDQALATLEALGDSPGETMLGLAEDAGVPAVGEVRDALPGALEDELVGWIDDQVAGASLDGQPAHERIGTIAAELRGSLTSLDLRTTMTLPGETAGTGTHELDAIVLTPVTTAPLSIPAPLVPIVGTDGFEYRVVPGEGAAAPQLEIGEHGFGLPLGTIAGAAADRLVEEILGVPDLRSALGLLIDCGQIAEAVSDQCVAFVCVGHEDELAELCEGALDELAARVHEELASLDVDAVHFLSGAAALGDRDADGVADTIEQGVWDARLNVGAGERDSNATFAGSR